MNFIKYLFENSYIIAGLFYALLTGVVIGLGVGSLHFFSWVFDVPVKDAFIPAILFWGFCIWLLVHYLIYSEQWDS